MIAPSGALVVRRRRPGRRVAAIALSAAVAIVIGGVWLLASSGGAGAGSPPVRAPAVRSIPASTPLNFTLVLRLAHGRSLRAALAGIESPSSPKFRRLIDARSFGKRFGIPTLQLRLLERRLRALGVRITATYPQQTAMQVRAPAATVERLFKIRIRNFKGAAGGPGVHAPIGTPTIPAGLAPFVSGVTGLDTRSHMIAHDTPMGGMTPAETAIAYDTAPLRQMGILGQGQTIAVISFSGYKRSDPATFTSHFSLGGPQPEVIPVDGGTSNMSGADEANLDIDMIKSIAPDAQILFYEVPQGSGAYTDVINRIVADHRASIISSSWGQCELDLDPSELAGDGAAISAADAAGLSLFVATGDSGAFDCQDARLSDHRLSVDWPASSPGVIAVGGTRLYLNGNYTYNHETGWEGPLSDAGGGGGLTTAAARPAWQSGPGVINVHSDGRRQVPDVSAEADPATGWVTYSGGQLDEAGGTSAATPFWAASMLLIKQYAAMHGVRSLGFVDPILYRLAASADSPFHDIRTGGNRFYQATTGWDYATGLGSPNVWKLAQDMVSYLHSHGPV